MLIGEKNHATEDDERGNQQDSDAASQPALSLRSSLSSIGFACGTALRTERSTVDRQYEDQSEFEYKARH